MHCPAFPAILDALHPEETNGVPAAHHSEGCGHTVSQKVELIVILLIISYQDSSIDFHSFEAAVLTRCDGSIMILCDFDDPDAMLFVLIGLEYYMALSLLGVQGFGLAPVDHNVVDVPGVDQIDCHFLGA